MRWFFVPTDADVSHYIRALEKSKHPHAHIQIFEFFATVFCSLGALWVLGQAGFLPASVTSQGIAMFGHATASFAALGLVSIFVGNRPTWNDRLRFHVSHLLTASWYASIYGLFIFLVFVIGINVARLFGYNLIRSVVPLPSNIE